MGKSPCADDPHGDEKKGPWTPEEDQKLVDYIEKHGHGSWRALPKLAGLNRSGKSCRLRWTNYLRPDIKRGQFSEEEEHVILRLHSFLGNKWSAIATQLPGRTDNEIKNFWNTHLKKKLIQMGIDPTTHQPITNGFIGIMKNFDSVMQGVFNAGVSSLYEDGNGLSIWENQLNGGHREISQALFQEMKKARIAEGSSLCGRTKESKILKLLRFLEDRKKPEDRNKYFKLMTDVLQFRATGERGDGDEDESIKTRDLATSSSVVVKEKSVNDLINDIFDHEVDFLELYSRKDEVLQVYQEEKVKLARLLNELSCRFSLQIDWVAAVQGASWIMKVHYIDDCWERQNKIINIGMSYYYNENNYDNVVEAIKQSRMNLNIDMNICSVVFAGDVNDRDSSSDNSWFSQRNSFAFAGFLPDIVELIGCDSFGELVQSNIFDALLTSVTKPIVDAIRRCVDYVHQTPSKVKFISASNKGNSVGKKAILKDDPGRCCSGFECLEIAFGLKEAFYELEKTDPDFVPINLTAEKWDEATATFQHLKLLFGDVRSFSNGRKCDILDLSPVKNFPKLIYMHKVLVTGCTQSKNCLVCRDASHEIQNFLVLFWSKLCLVSIIQIILDPRFKMDAVKLWYEELYGSAADEYFEKITKEFKDVYDEYARENFSRSCKRILDSMQMPCGSSKSELALYLEDLKVPAIKEFDILAWWRGNAPFYPTLAKMARDYLAVPVFHAPAISSTLRSEIKTTLELRLCTIEDELLQAVLCVRDWSRPRILLDNSSKGDLSTNCSTNCNQLHQRQEQMQPAGLPQPQSLTGSREPQHFTGKQADEDEEDLPITDSSSLFTDEANSGLVSTAFEDFL